MNLCIDIATTKLYSEILHSKLRLCKFNSNMKVYNELSDDIDVEQINLIGNYYTYYLENSVVDRHIATYTIANT